LAGYSFGIGVDGEADAASGLFVKENAKKKDAVKVNTTVVRDNDKSILLDKGRVIDFTIMPCTHSNYFLLYLKYT
jgi:hypothetical protein